MCVVRDSPHWKKAGEDKYGRSKAGGQIDRIRSWKDEGANGVSALDGQLLEPEGDRKEEQRGEEPSPTAEGHRPQGGERRPVRGYHDAPITVHCDDR